MTVSSHLSKCAAGSYQLTVALHIQASNIVWRIYAKEAQAKLERPTSWFSILPATHAAETGRPGILLPCAKLYKEHYMGEEKVLHKHTSKHDVQSSKADTHASFMHL